MKRLLLLILGLLAFITSIAQEIYISNSENELKILDVSNFSITDVLTVDSTMYGVVLDIAFNPEGRLFATTSFNTIIEINLNTQEISEIFDLPLGSTYPGLGANSNNELITSKFLQLELYSYNIDTQEFSFVESDISTPGDFTYFRGNLVYPSFFNDFIKAYDGNNITNVGCSVPLLFGIANIFENCETNAIYAFDEDAKVYLYTLGESEFQEVADLWNETGPIFGAATLSEYMASACTLQNIEPVNCDILSIDDPNPYGIELYPNPAVKILNFKMGMKMEMLSYKIWDLNGRLLLNGILEGQTIDIEELVDGLYFLHIYDESKRQVFQEPIIKQ